MPSARGFRSLSAPTLLAIAFAGAPAIGQQPTTPTDPELRTYLTGNGLLSRGMNELAAAEYRRFLSENAGHDRAPHARYGLAVALYRQNLYAEAAEVLAGAEPASGFEFAAEMAMLRARCGLAMGEFELAAAQASLLLKEHPQHDLADDAGAALVEARYQAGRHAEALEAAAQFHERWPQSPLAARTDLFAGLAEIGTRADGAAAARLAALAKRWPESPHAPQAVLLAAQCAHRVGDVPAAKAGYEAALSSADSRHHPESLLGLAILERSEGDLERARTRLDRLIKDYPNAPQAIQAYLERGRALLELGDVEQSGADFERYASDKAADKAQADFWLARWELRSGDAAAAADRLGRAVRRHADSDLLPLMRFDHAVALIESGQSEAAVEALQEFQDQHPAHALNAEAFEMLAMIAHRAGEYERSLALCGAFAEQYPAHALRPRIDLLSAENALLSGDDEAAAAGYRAFLQAHSADASADLARFRLGCALVRLDKPSEAQPLLTAAAAKAKDRAEFRPALLHLGDIAFAAGRWPEAESHWRAFLSLADSAEGSDEALLKLGLALSRQGRDADALEQYQRLLAEHPRSPHIDLGRLEMARSLLALHREPEARALLQETAEGDRAQLRSLALTQLANLAAKRGENDLAARLFADAGEDGDTDAAAEAALGLSAVQLSRGEPEASRDTLRELLRDSPDHPRADEARARLALAEARIEPGAAAAQVIDAALQGMETLSPDLRDALRYELAACQRAAGQATEAGETLSALADHAQSPSLRIHAAADLAQIHMDAERFEEAAAVLAKTQPLIGGDQIPAELRQHIHYQAAACAYRLGRHEDAARGFAAFAAEHAASPLAPSAELLAGESLLRLERHSQAAAHLRTAAETLTTDAQRRTAHLRLGDCLAALQDWEASAEAFRASLESESGGDHWYQARFGLGWALENQAQLEPAMREYAKVVAGHQGPTAARAQFQIGECLFAMGKHEEAAAELLKVDILYDYPQWSAAALYEAGRCFEALGQPTRAAEQFKAVRDQHAQTSWAPLAAERLKSLSLPLSQSPGKAG